MSPSIADPLTEEGSRTDEVLPRRPRRHFVTGPTMAVLAIVTCAVGFYGGIRVEKSHASGSTSGSRLAALTGGQAAFGGGGGAAGATGASGAGTSGARKGASASGAPSGFPGRGGFAGFGGAGGGTAGTVSSVNGKTLVLDETGGNTVKVKLTSATTISKTETVGHKAVHPGDTITVTGSSSKGTISAASISDSGDTSTSSSSSSSSSSSGSSSGGVRSLFGG